MIFIGYNYDGYPISIISAKSQESANAYWQGKDQLPYSSKSFDINEDRENENEGYVTPLLKTKEVDAYLYRNNSGKLLMIDK